MSEVQHVDGKVKKRITKIADLVVEYLVSMGVPRYEIFKMDDAEYKRAKFAKDGPKKSFVKQDWESIVVGGIAFYLDH